MANAADIEHKRLMEEIMGESTGELLPCPFCRSPVRWCGEGDAGCGETDCIHIQCDNCGMHFSDESTQAFLANTVEEARDYMRKRWNTRIF